MIICGYAGIGKSYLAHNFPNVIDLESTPFEKDWDRYFKCAKHYSEQGFLVLLSCHKEIRKRVLKMPYEERITIFPCIDDKDLFEIRYKERGNTQEFINIQMEHWDEWTSEKNRLFGEHLEYMESGETLYDTIIRLSKLSPNRFCTYDQCPLLDCSLMKDTCLNPLEKICKENKTMEQYIKKSALMAELNRLIVELLEEGEDTMFEQGRISAFEDVKVFINHTLEVNEVDLEKEATEFVQTKEFVESKESPVLLIAKYFFELGLKAQKGE